MSRFFLTDAPAMSPGVCWITKTGVGPFIDTGVDLSLHVVDRGRIYISVDAIREMAQIAGLFDETAPVSVELRRKEFYDQGYKDALEEMNKDVINNFVERVVSNSALAAGAATVLAPEVHHTAAGAAVTDSASADAGAQQDSADAGKAKRKSAGTGSVKRSASVSTNPSDDANFRL
jgi:hypothetical protein